MAVGLASCASQAAPTGGPDDRRPPVVVRTEPEAFSVLEDLGSRVRFHFDERISELVPGATLDEIVTVSPRTGEVSVGHSRRSLSVSVDGGFRPGLVYRVTLRPIVSDLFGNQLRDAFELVFSTGGDPSPTTMAGQVWNRVTGDGVSDALVHAVGADSLVHIARTGNDGIYAFRYLPGGAFRVTAFEDLDRDGEVGVREVQGSTTAGLAAGDTVLLDVAVLPADTTPAVATSASVLDSLTLVIEFDDYLNPEEPSDRIGVRLFREGGDGPVVTRLFHDHEYRAYFDEVADSLARLDSIAAAAAAAQPRQPVAPPDTAAGAAADSLPDADPAPVQPVDTVRTAPSAAPSPPRRGPPPLPGGARSRSGGNPDRLLPARRVVGRVVEPLATGVEYEVRVTSVVNLNGLPGGGGDVVLLRETVDADSTAVVPDSLRARPDTASRR